MKLYKNSSLILFLLIVVMTVTSGCTTTIAIEDVKNQDNVGKTVSVYGTVKNTINIGELSGYTIEDETDTISVSSESLPEEGTKIRVTGTLVKDTLFGYYIKAD
ncbi:MAG: hypothetical protein ACQESF_04655 [Nanobdellota archaeon]